MEQEVLYSFAPFILPIISLLGGLFGNRSQTQESTQQSNSSGSGSNTSSYNNSQMPVLSDMQQGLAEMFTTGAINRANRGPTDLTGYATGALKNINTGGDIKSKIASNILASRGQSFSNSAGNVLSNIESDRVDQGTDVINQLPLLQRQLENDDLNSLMKAFGILPTGQVGSGNQDSSFTQQSSGSGSGTNMQPGNMLGGAFGGLGQGLFAPINAQGGTSLDGILKMLFGGG